ncbi:MAG: MarR family transcriptional regulator [Spirulina sp.]
MAGWPSRPLLRQARSWLTAARNNQQEDVANLCPLPTLWNAALRRRLAQWPIPDVYQTTAQERLSAVVTAWQQDPDAPNSLVILSSPVEDTEALMESLMAGDWLGDLPQAVRVWRPMAWQVRPPNPLNLAEQFSKALAEIPSKTAQTDDDHPDPLSQRRRLVIMPPLEQCFLRCIGGWQGVEWLRDTVGQYPQYFWVIRCNTWAWTFLNRVCQVESYFSETLVLPSLDKAMLSDWLRPFAADLQPESSTTESGEAADAPLDEMEARGWSWSELASLSRGQAVVAQYLWLRSLRLREEDVPEQPQPLDQAGPLPVPLQLLPATLPSLPSLTAEDHYVLHALMLHGSMTRSHLAQSLGLAANLVEVNVQRLRQAGVLRQTRQGISLYPAYYPLVLAELKSNNFLTGEAK